MGVTEKLLELQKSRVNQFSLVMFKKIAGFLKHFVILMIGYSFMAWIFLGIYDTIGFEKTLIVLLIGVFYYGIRR